MTPSTIAGAVLVGALVPGYLYLVLTEQIRRPRDQTPLAELLQVALVGVATTGAATAALLLVIPGMALEVTRTLGTDSGGVTAGALRQVVGFAVLDVAVAIGFAVGLAALTSLRAKQRYAPTVLQGALGGRRRGTARWVSAELEDGTVFDGKLRAYPFTDDREKIVVALERPIRRFKDGQVKELPYDRLILTGGDISSLSLNYQPERQAPARSPSRRQRVASKLSHLLAVYADR